MIKRIAVRLKKVNRYCGRAVFCELCNMINSGLHNGQPGIVGSDDARLTVVVPVYNRVAKVVRMLESLQCQTVSPAEIVVVDNGSTDNTAAAVRACFGNWRVHADGRVPALTLLTDAVRGACHARNVGLAAVRTEWTMFFDSDDVMLPHHIERAMHAASCGAQVVGWDISIMADPTESDHGGMGVYKAASGSIKPFEMRDIVYHNLFHATFATHRYMARTELFRRAGGWNPDVPIWNDIELGNRMISVLASEGCVPGSIVKVHGPVSVHVYRSSRSITGASFSSRAGKYDQALACIEAGLTERQRPYVDLKRVILAANMEREGSPAGRQLYRCVMGRAVGRYRLLFAAAYRYTASGGRGIARLVRPLMPK